MIISQYVYFSIASEQVSAQEIGARLGLSPDEHTVRGSRSALPMVPKAHSWKVVCRESGLCVDEQVERLVERLEQYAVPIGALADELAASEGGRSATLQVVRYLNSGADPEYRVLGWHLDARVLDFLRVTRAELDVDEYGHECPADPEDD
ncbi:hypothetical protein Lfu02_02230 [Longispora fulva]|uniref:DUF4279 domain-containing protein n=1 Tax=Longispora fulva TaxID=619741 RepID=A0A8J7KJV5_9ACTN|nr:DUF4279 domain-containing protein [Longispora fulva]MBG6135906.1 hypothetical protein [Longispora fulva]GIG55851.1 hypothetical protein Lfu02_02230 [Longispora fulva]